VKHDDARTVALRDEGRYPLEHHTRARHGGECDTVSADRSDVKAEVRRGSEEVTIARDDDEIDVVQS
jgi:hypothetical protein